MEPKMAHAATPGRHASESASSTATAQQLLGQSVFFSESSEDDKEKMGRLFSVQTNMTEMTGYTSSDVPKEAGRLYGEDGQLIHLPAPTKDPRDPMNLPLRRKIIGLFCLCCFGALASSAELVLGSMLPVFALEYANVDPKMIKPLAEQHAFPPGVDPLVVLSRLPNAPPIWHTYLLGSLPILVMGLSNLILIPLAISIGRRPVILLCGLCAIAGAIWAGFSRSLSSHIGGRCLQAIGAGTIESLIPFIIQDIVFFHQRNTAISSAFAAQGFIIIAVGIAAPHLIINLSWRWVYFITSAGAAFFLVGVFVLMPETRWTRTRAELDGIPRREQPGTVYEPRSWSYDLALMQGPPNWRKGINALFDSLRTFFYPHIFFITMLNSAMMAATFAASFTVSPHLLASPYNWAFLNLGLCLVPVLIAAGFVALVTGTAADKLANFLARKRGRRLPENQLINLVLPTISGIIGSLLFGLAGSHPDRYPWPVFVVGLGMVSFGFLGANTVGAVYVLESYPNLAGPALVNIASFRCILAFTLSFKVSQWIVDMGYLDSMIIYTSVMAFIFVFIPVVYIWGPAWRRRWPGPEGK